MYIISSLFNWDVQDFLEVSTTTLEMDEIGQN